MKVFMHKLKKTNKVFLTLYLLSVIFYLVSYIIFTINLIHLSNIETPIRILAIVFFGFWFIVWLIAGLMSMFTKKYKPFIILIVFTLLFGTIFDFASYFIGKLYSNIESISKDKIVYTSNLISLKDTNFDKNSKIGMINDSSDIEGYILGNKLVKDNSLTNEIERYDDYLIMLNDLYEKKIDGCVVSGNYVVNFSSEEQFENIKKDTKIIYTYSEEMNNQDNVSYSNKKLTEPFTILLMGVDSEIDGLNANQAFNGDTLMLVTFNPKTLTASTFSMPRDTYVPIACRNNQYNKINSSAASGTSCVINTLKNLTGIDIDFYLKINFKGVVSLVDSLGGITVDVEQPYFRVNNGIDYHGQVCEQNSSREFGNNIVCIDPGVQRLNGEQALAYSRNRHQYIGSDIDRVKHQQQVLSATVQEIKNIKTFEQFENILKTVEKNMDTNMKSDQILSLYNVAKKIVQISSNSTGDPVSINKTYLETYSLPVWTGYSHTSALGYYKDSLDEIIQMMKVNLELEHAQLTKTYSIDFNEEYTSRFYGQGKRSTPMESLMINLIGSTKEYATSWASEHNLNPIIKYVENGDEHYSPVCYNCVSDQSIHIDELINGKSEITLYINNTKDYTPTEVIPNYNNQANDNTTESNNSTTEKNEDKEEKKDDLPSEISPISSNTNNDEDKENDSETTL